MSIKSYLWPFRVNKDCGLTIDWKKLDGNSTASLAESQLQKLLYAVERKFPGETRFETALRYIRQAESHAAKDYGCHCDVTDDDTIVLNRGGRETERMIDGMQLTLKKY